MQGAVRAVLSNPTITFLVLGFVAAALAIARLPNPRPRAAVYDALVRWFLFFSVGAAMLYNFVLHVFFGDSTARFIGWADSPFQAEVGYASLGFAVVGFMAFRGGSQLRLAALAGPACFLVGAGIGHVYQIATTHNVAPGNAGSVLYTDFALPAVGFVLLWLAWRSARA